MNSIKNTANDLEAALFEINALRAIVEALPRCAAKGCDRVATHLNPHGVFKCSKDAFGYDTALPYAEALRAYEARK
jgi:hypothetical protein